MGCDGGTIPRRDEMVKLKKKAEKVSEYWERKGFMTRTCDVHVCCLAFPSLSSLCFQADRDMELMARWRHCALSGEELKQPIVACDLGR